MGSSLDIRGRSGLRGAKIIAEFVVWKDLLKFYRQIAKYTLKCKERHESRVFMESLDKS